MTFKESLSGLNPFDTISNIFKTGYSVYQDQRDFNYTKNLQQQLFSRDDNAMQRRMQDYQNAGINPLFALGGSGAGVSSAGAAAGVPLQIDNSFFSDQQRKKLERETIKDEMDKRQYEKDLMKIQIKSGKIANLQALQDLNTKQLEYRILQNQLMNYDEFGYYPTSQIGKTVYDVSQIIKNTLPGVNPFKPLSLFEYVKNGITDPKWIDYLNKAQNFVENKVEDFVEKKVDKNSGYNIKGTKHPHAGYLYKVQQNFNRINNTKYRLDFIPDSKFSNRGVLKLYNKRTKKYESPSFVNLDSVIRFINYGSVKY